MIAQLLYISARWKEDISEEDGKKLVRDAIAAGVFNDLGSGSNVDLCVIRKNYSTEYLRGYEYANVKGEREVNEDILLQVQSPLSNLFYHIVFQLKYDFKKGTTPVLKTSIKHLEITETVRPIAGSSHVPMDTA